MSIQRHQMRRVYLSLWHCPRISLKRITPRTLRSWYLTFKPGTFQLHSDSVLVWRSGESNPGEDDIFRTSPDRHRGPPRLQYKGYRVSSPRVKQLGRDVNYPTTSKIEVEERVDLYFYFPSGPLWLVIGWILPLSFILRLQVRIITAWASLSGCIKFCVWATEFRSL